MIPSSTLLDVSDFFVPHRILTSPVSIHAPTWGATYADRQRQGKGCFNPHSHMGSDTCKTEVEHAQNRFNPRSHMGSDE